MKKELNILMDSDSYKYSHYLQYPDGVVNMYEYAEARSIENYDKMLFVGLYGILKEYFTSPITTEDVEEASMYAKYHGEPFNYNGFIKIVKEYNGFLPVTIKAIPEGLVIPNKTIPFTVELTRNDRDLFWLPSWLETFLMRVWFPINCATRTYHVKEMLLEMAKKTTENPNVDFQFHSFSSRGTNTVEGATIGGFAHLTCFKGTDNFSALKYAHEIYNEPLESIAWSIPATEHSTMSSEGRYGEFNVLKRFLEKNKGNPLAATVADTYDVYNYTDVATSGEFKEKIESDDYPKLVLRPDSNDPRIVIPEMLDIMEKNKVKFTENKKGYKSFNKYSGLWGDGVDMNAMRDICSLLIMNGYETNVFAFGSGGWLSSSHTRDLMGFAIKCSELTFMDGSTMDIYKDPITDPGKKSKKGKVTTYFNKETSEFFTDIIGKDTKTIINIVKPLFINGKMVKDYTLSEIRESVDNQLAGNNFNFGEK